MDQPQTSHVRHRRNKQQIQKLLKLHSASNVSVKDFCREHNIHPAVFYKWKNRYKGKVGNNPKFTGFTTLDIVEGLPAGLPRLFAEVKGIRIYQPVSALFLKELMG